MPEADDRSSMRPGGAAHNRAGRAVTAPGDFAGSEEAPSPEDLAGGDADPLDPRIAAILPAQLIQPNEIIILLLKPSLLYIPLSCIGFLIAVAAGLAVALTLRAEGYTFGIGRQDLILLAIGMAGIRLFWQFLEWLSRVYVLTDRRVIRVQGVLRVAVFEAPLKQVQHTQTLFSIRERLFALGTVAFATAGTGLTEAAWQMVAQPLEVHRIVVDALNRYR